MSVDGSNKSLQSAAVFKRVSLLFLPALLLGAGMAGSAGEPPASAAQAEYEKTMQPLLTQYCGKCHGEKGGASGIDLGTFHDVIAIQRDQTTWRKVVTRIRERTMPPPGTPQPSQEQRNTVSDWLTKTLDSADPSLLPKNPGRVLIHRLSRQEYNNTVRDLCGVDIHPADDFPNDDVGYGFDNIGDVLSLSPLLMEKYLNAAEKVSHAAFQSPDEFIKPNHFDPGGMVFISQSSNGGDSASLPTTGSEAGVDYDFPKSADYLLRSIAYQDKAGPEDAKMQMKLDGKEVAMIDVKAQKRSPQPYMVGVTVPAGKHRFSCVFTNDFYDPGDPKNKNNRARDRNLYLKALEIVGPLAGNEALSPLKKQLGEFEPNEATRTTVARKFISDFARRAYRRPVTRDEVDHLTRYVDLAVKQGETFQKGIEIAMTAALCSPNFLFRVETTSVPVVPAINSGKVKASTAKFIKDAKSGADKNSVNGFALASRIAYFLWSSMPDDELFNLAANGKLQDPTVLAAQVKRMLKDPRAHALADNFAGQWLMLRSLAGVTPDTKRFPDFNDHMRQSMRKETELFFQNIVSEDRSILDFLDANYTFLNETLAKHYGIADVQGDNFRKVMLTGDQRGGLLAQASLLTVTSNPTRTSPVKRGKWVMENLLGTPLPPAPPNVPALSDDKKGPLVGTLRQRMEQHRANPACASCHARMDPIGFGLENYDAVGQWRTKDGDSSIDPSGVLPDGSKFSGPAELKQILKTKKTLFTQCLTQKMMTYALGRGVERIDKCTIDNIVQTTSKNGYHFSTLVTAIIQCDPFRKQRGDGGL